MKNILIELIRLNIYLVTTLRKQEMIKIYLIEIDNYTFAVGAHY